VRPYEEPLTAMPPPPTRIIIQQPAPMIIRYVSPDSYALLFYSFIGPYMPCSPYGITESSSSP
jgi:hypothetical protein